MAEREELAKEKGQRDRAVMARKAKLDALGGPCDVRSWQELSVAERAELRLPQRAARQF